MAIRRTQEQLRSRNTFVRTFPFLYISNRRLDHILLETSPVAVESPLPILFCIQKSKAQVCYAEISLNVVLTPTALLL